MKVIYQNEVDRLNFIINRDGKDAAIEFARRGIKTYREGVLRSHRRKNFRNYGIEFKVSHLSAEPMRRFAILSYLQYKEFLKYEKL